jgi:single-stranded DNA-binding protein
MKAARLGAMMRALATTRSRTMSAAVAPPRSRAPATTAASAASTPARRPLAPPPHASTGSYGATPPLDVVTWDKDTANQVQLIGNVGGVDFKLLPNGTPVSTVRLAVRKPRREDAQSEADADTNWCATLKPSFATVNLSPPDLLTALPSSLCGSPHRFTVEAFDALAQQINEHVKVGAQVAVTGRLRQECVHSSSDRLSFAREFSPLGRAVSGRTRLQDSSGTRSSSAQPRWRQLQRPGNEPSAFVVACRFSGSLARADCLPALASPFTVPALAEWSRTR